MYNNFLETCRKNEHLKQYMSNKYVCVCAHKCTDTPDHGAREQP